MSRYRGEFFKFRGQLFSRKVQGERDKREGVSAWPEVGTKMFKSEKGRNTRVLWFVKAKRTEKG